MARVTPSERLTRHSRRARAPLTMNSMEDAQGATGGSNSTRSWEQKRWEIATCRHRERGERRL